MERSDTELVEASRRGEREAFGHLVERYQDVVCAVSYSSTRDWSLSEDVAQDTFIAAWRSLGQLREIGRLRPWLIGIARNLARKASKRRNRDAGSEANGDELPATGTSPFEHTARGESERVVRDALARVPQTYREVLVLYYGENRSVREVADALAISEANALTRLARGRRYLAAGVTELVERSLRGSHVRRSLAPGVLAAVTALGITSSRVDASPTAKGSTMLKVAIAAITLAAAGTTAAVVHHNHTTDAHVSAAPAPSAATPSHTAHAPLRIAGAPQLGHAIVDEDANPLPPGAIRVHDDPNPLKKDVIEKLGLYRGPARGPDTAKVTIVLFQDSVCPYCGHVLGTIDQLWDEYPGKLRLVIKQFPVHQVAKLAGEAMYAADAQGKFWEMHDTLLAHQDAQTHDDLIQYAQQIGLDVGKFTTALDTHAFAPAVAADQEAGKAIDVKGTPAFLINGRKFMGARPIEDFRASIDAALQD